MAWLGVLGMLAQGQPARAAHPLQTEDTGTQGLGELEWEHGYDRWRAGAARGWAYRPQLSYGLGETLDLIVQPSWLQRRDEDGVMRRGLGDTQLDLKWSFGADEGLSFGVRAGLTLPTGRPGLGLPGGRPAAQALLITSWARAPFTLHANLGLLRNPAATGRRSNQALANAALTWAASEQWTWVLDGGVQASPEIGRQRWPGTLVVAAIWTLQPGLDLDLGHQAEVNGPARAWLLGLTWRSAR